MRTRFSSIRRTAIVCSAFFAVGCGEPDPVGSVPAASDWNDVLVSAFESIDARSPDVEKLLWTTTYRLTPESSLDQSQYSWLLDHGYIEGLGAPRGLVLFMDSIAHFESVRLDPDVFARLGVDPYRGNDSGQVITRGLRLERAADSTRVFLVRLGTPLIRGDQALVDFSYRCGPFECWERGLVFLKRLGSEWIPVGRVITLFT